MPESNQKVTVTGDDYINVIMPKLDEANTRLIQEEARRLSLTREIKRLNDLIAEKDKEIESLKTNKTTKPDETPKTVSGTDTPTKAKASPKKKGKQS